MTKHFSLYIFENPSKRETNEHCNEQNINKEIHDSVVKTEYVFIYLDKPIKFVNRNLNERL